MTSPIQSSLPFQIETALQSWFNFGSREFLQQALHSRLSFVFDFRVEVAATSIDGNREWAEVFNAKFPEALRHQVLPVHLFDRFNLSCLKSGGSANDG